MKKRNWTAAAAEIIQTFDPVPGCYCSYVTWCYIYCHWQGATVDVCLIVSKCLSFCSSRLQLDLQTSIRRFKRGPGTEHWLARIKTRLILLPVAVQSMSARDLPDSCCWVPTKVAHPFPLRRKACLNLIGQQDVWPSLGLVVSTWLLHKKNEKKKKK